MAKKKEMDQLTKDAIAAWNAGMSYGKWKAMQYKPGDQPKKQVAKKEVHYCAICGKEIVDWRTGKKYCSPLCAQDGRNIKYREYYLRRVNDATD